MWGWGLYHGITSGAGAVTGWKWDALKKKVENDDNFDFCKRAAYKVVGMVAATVLAPLGALFGMASNHVSRMKRMGKVKTAVMIVAVATRLSVQLPFKVMRKLIKK